MSDAASASLAQARQIILDADAVFGLAFIGYTDPELSIPEAITAWELLEERDYPESFPFMKEMTPRQCAPGGGSELYCLVPFSEGDLVVIEQAETLEGEPVEPYTEIYCSTSGEPVFFTADSNGWGGSDVIVTVKDVKGRELRCNPAMWSNLAMLVQTDGVADLTIYPDDSPAAMFRRLAGEWSFGETVDGKRLNYLLTLSDGGEAAMEVTGDGAAEKLMEFRGSWIAREDYLSFDLELSGGTEYDPAGEEKVISAGYAGTFADDRLDLTLDYGDSLPVSGAAAVSLSRSLG